VVRQYRRAATSLYLPTIVRSSHDRAVHNTLPGQIFDGVHPERLKKKKEERRKKMNRTQAKKVDRINIVDRHTPPRLLQPPQYAAHRQHRTFYCTHVAIAFVLLPRHGHCVADHCIPAPRTHYAHATRVTGLPPHALPPPPLHTRAHLYTPQPLPSDLFAIIRDAANPGATTHYASHLYPHLFHYPHSTCIRAHAHHTLLWFLPTRDYSTNPATWASGGGVGTTYEDSRCTRTTACARPVFDHNFARPLQSCDDCSGPTPSPAFYHCHTHLLLIPFYRCHPYHTGIVGSSWWSAVPHAPHIARRRTLSCCIPSAPFFFFNLLSTFTLRKKKRSYFAHLCHFYAHFTHRRRCILRLLRFAFCMKDRHQTGIAAFAERAVLHAAGHLRCIAQAWQ